MLVFLHFNVPGSRMIVALIFWGMNGDIFSLVEAQAQVLGNLQAWAYRLELTRCC